MIGVTIFACVCVVCLTVLLWVYMVMQSYNKAYYRNERDRRREWRRQVHTREGPEQSRPGRL